MDTQPTPGPWHLQTKGPGYYIQAAAEDGNPVNVAILNAEPADARLMTAAPTLLDLLRRAAEVLHAEASGAAELLSEIDEVLDDVAGVQPKCDGFPTP